MSNVRLNMFACRVKFAANCRARGAMHQSCYSPTNDRLITRHASLITFFRRGGRAVECAGLENRKTARSREFESHPLRASSNTLPVNFAGHFHSCDQMKIRTPFDRWGASRARVKSE